MYFILRHLILLGETFRRAKVTNFSFSDENFAQRIVSPDESFARQSFARQGSKISLIQAYFEPDIIENLSVFEPRIEKHYAY